MCYEENIKVMLIEKIRSAFITCPLRHSTQCTEAIATQCQGSRPVLSLMFSQPFSDCLVIENIVLDGGLKKKMFLRPTI